MPKPLIAYAKGPYLAVPPVEKEEPAALEPLQTIFVRLRERIGMRPGAVAPHALSMTILRPATVNV
jgi:hypothetical protein